MYKVMVVFLNIGISEPNIGGGVNIRKQTNKGKKKQLFWPIIFVVIA